MPYDTSAPGIRCMFSAAQAHVLSAASLTSGQNLVLNECPVSSVIATADRARLIRSVVSCLYACLLCSASVSPVNGLFQGPSITKTHAVECRVNSAEHRKPDWLCRVSSSMCWVAYRRMAAHFSDLHVLWPIVRQVLAQALLWMESIRVGCGKLLWTYSCY